MEEKMNNVRITMYGAIIGAVGLIVGALISNGINYISYFNDSRLKKQIENLKDTIEDQTKQIELRKDTIKIQNTQIDSLQNILKTQQTQIKNLEDNLKICKDQRTKIEKLISDGNRILIDIKNDKPGVSSDYKTWEQKCKGINSSISQKIDDIEKNEDGVGADLKTKTERIINLLKTSK
ncbi:MAG: hypothetical protein LBO74_12420 [Candidatus Symbiothrix sp.]|jgi:predicted  nucleic acid-binding Zn-ribbon protein|nr:hypothetical protein [Candidatus Symbiothrix sp.]